MQNLFQLAGKPLADLGGYYYLYCGENNRRRDTSAEMRAGGFDIVTEAKKLEEFYFDLLK